MTRIAASGGTYDLAVVGAGIVGLAHALAAARHGRRVVVIDREARANGASVRNFGFVTVTGQQRGETWRRARRARDVWDEVAAPAGIDIVQRGLVVAARSAEAMAVLEAFLGTEMGADCMLIDAAAARRCCPALRAEGLMGALWSPHERRVDPRDAIPRLARFLEQEYGVVFLRGAHVHDAAPPRIETSAGTVGAARCVVCPGEDLLSLFAERLARYPLTKTVLHMMRLVPECGDRPLSVPVMSDTSLVRYLGYAALPQSEPLRRRIEQAMPEVPRHGIHLIVVREADGSLVVGDSHHDDATPAPFYRGEVEAAILRLFEDTLDIGGYRVAERWLGVYPSSAERTALVDRPAPRVRVAVVSSGTGMSTAFALAEEVVADLFEEGPPASRTFDREEIAE